MNDPLFFESNQNLLGIGVGVQILLPRGLYASFDLAKSLRELKVGGNVTMEQKALTIGYMETWMDFKRSMRNKNKTIIFLVPFSWCFVVYMGYPKGVSQLREEELFPRREAP